MSFRDIQLVLNKSPSACKASLGRAGSYDDIFTDYIWTFLSHPHQGRKGKPVGEKNKCIASLPRLKYSAGPKIIYDYEKLNSIVKSCCGKNVYGGIKFIYKLYHSSKNPNNYINIVEHVTVESDTFIQDGEKLNWSVFTTLLREMYAASLECQNAIDTKMLLRNINIKTYYEI